MNNISHLTKGQLKALYIDFTVYRDRECNGLSKVSVFEFYRINKDRYN
jgi:hypothetical protein